MITVSEYLTQHTTIDKVPADVVANAGQLIPKVNKLLMDAPFDNSQCKVRSGYRPLATGSSAQQEEDLLCLGGIDAIVLRP